MSETVNDLAAALFWVWLKEGHPERSTGTMAEAREAFERRNETDREDFLRTAEAALGVMSRPS